MDKLEEQIGTKHSAAHLKAWKKYCAKCRQDPEYNQRALERNRQYQERNKEKLNARRRFLYKQKKLAAAAASERDIKRYSDTITSNK
jgi:hypothetical protein